MRLWRLLPLVLVVMVAALSSGASMVAALVIDGPLILQKVRQLKLESVMRGVRRRLKKFAGPKREFPALEGVLDVTFSDDMQLKVTRATESEVTRAKELEVTRATELEVTRAKESGVKRAKESGVKRAKESEKDVYGTLTYRNETDLFVLKGGSELFHPDYIFPLAVMANLSLERTWSSRAGELVLRRKYAPRWEAFMKPLISFVNVLSKMGRDELRPLNGSCIPLQGYSAHHRKTMAGYRYELSMIEKPYYGYYGADPGAVGEWDWDDAVLVGNRQLWCGLRIYEAYGKTPHQVLQIVMNTMSSSKHLVAAMAAKANNPHDFLTYLSKDLPLGWKFSRGKKGLLRRGLSWLGAV